MEFVEELCATPGFVGSVFVPLCMAGNVDRRRFRYVVPPLEETVLKGQLFEALYAVNVSMLAGYRHVTLTFRIILAARKPEYSCLLQGGIGMIQMTRA